MALEWADGFDTYAVSQIGRRYATYGTTNAAMVTGYQGRGQAFTSHSVNGNIVMPLTPRKTYTIGFHFYSTSFSPPGTSSEIWFQLLSQSAGVILTLAGSVTSFYVNGTSSGSLTGSWQYITLQVTQDPAAGAITVKVDGVTVYNATGLNTGSSPIAALKISGTSTADSFYFDDLWVFNTLGSHSNGFPTGDILVPGLYPVADGTFQGFTPSTPGPHYAMVDQAQADDDTTYVYSPTPAADSYNIGAIPSGGVLQVHGVLVTAIHRKDDVNPKILHLMTESGFAVAESPDINVPTSYTSSSLLLGDDPNTGNQWTVAAVNAMQPGVKEIS